MNESDSSWRYEKDGKAEAYASRSSVRHAEELGLLDRVFAALEIEQGLGTVLDAPCGTGRLCPFVQGRGATWSGLDGSESMLNQARLALGQGPELVSGKLDDLPFEDRFFDHVLSFRYLHHVPNEAQAAIVTELARVSRRGLILSAFHPRSSHEWQRKLRCGLFRRARRRFTTHPTLVDQMLDPLGFERRIVVRQGFLRDLWIGGWSRKEARS